MASEALRQLGIKRTIRNRKYLTDFHEVGPNIKHLGDELSKVLCSNECSEYLDSARLFNDEEMLDIANGIRLIKELVPHTRVRGDRVEYRWARHFRCGFMPRGIVDLTLSDKLPLLHGWLWCFGLKEILAESKYSIGSTWRQLNWNMMPDTTHYQCISYFTDIETVLKLLKEAHLMNTLPLVGRQFREVKEFSLESMRYVFVFNYETEAERLGLLLETIYSREQQNILGSEISKLDCAFLFYSKPEGEFTPYDLIVGPVPFVMLIISGVPGTVEILEAYGTKLNFGAESIGTIIGKTYTCKGTQEGAIGKRASGLLKQILMGL